MNRVCKLVLTMVFHFFVTQPTIKWGDPADLQDYKGGRDYASLEKFAKENLKPMCSPKNVDLCEADKKADIEKFLGMAPADLDKMIEESEAKIEKAEADFKAGVEKLQKQNHQQNHKHRKSHKNPKTAG